MRTLRSRRLRHDLPIYEELVHGDVRKPPARRPLKSFVTRVQPYANKFATRVVGYQTLGYYIIGLTVTFIQATQIFLGEH